MKSKFAQMLELQNTFNSTFNRDWITSGIPYYRATLVEIAETHEHLGYKWWKKAPDLDVSQVHIEIVDIWHFVMSQIIVMDTFWRNHTEDKHAVHSTSLVDKVFDCFVDSGVDQLTDRDTLSIDRTKLTLDELALVSLESQLNALEIHEVREYLRRIVNSFFRLCYAAALPIDRLFTLYVGKNALNVFRQSNGYSDGSYYKNWSLSPDIKIEDNVVLASIIDDYPMVGILPLFDHCMRRMAHEYEKVVVYNHSALAEQSSSV